MNKLQALSLDDTFSASKEQLLDWVTEANTAYRAGSPVIPDEVYDVLIQRLHTLDPDNPFLSEVEPEPELVTGKTVPLPARMLSTEKVYSNDKIQSWVARVVKEAAEIGVAQADLRFRMTPKLDGFAAYDDCNKLYTRGDGRNGTDISHAIERGLSSLHGHRVVGPGEIVVDTKYFETHLADKYENTRNVIAAAIKEGELDPLIQAALTSVEITFVPFKHLLGWEGPIEMFEQVDAYKQRVSESKTWNTDGIVIEVLNEDVKAHMGSTGHHHRWQIAYKENVEFHDVKVRGLQWQTAKTGRITPVVLLEPTRISGVMVSKAAGHHAGNVGREGIDTDAVVKVCRSGLVIPYIVEVVTPVPAVTIPTNCPSCGAATHLDGDNLYCTNETDCPAQIERTIYHFFDTIGNCDGFGPSAISMLCADLGDIPSIKDVNDIYDIPLEDFELFGFGTKTAVNLFNELGESLKRPIEDWRFLAAFSLPGIGEGKAELLMKHHTLNDVFYCSVEEFMRIDGIGQKTASDLYEALRRLEGRIRALARRFTLVQTKGAEQAASPIAGMTLVFTGTMHSGSRDDMQAQARKLGANIGSSVTSKTSMLVCGDNVGQTKMDAALAKGVRVVSESEYLLMIGDTVPA